VLLVSLEEEESLLESLPRVGGKDQKMMIARRLAHHYPHYPYRSALCLGLDSANPKNNLWLMVSLGSAAVLDPWLRQLELAQYPLAAITTPILQGESYLRNFSSLPDPCLIIENGWSGTRLSLRKGKQLIFSRLISAETDWLAASRIQAERLLRYWVNHQLLPAGEQVPVIISAAALLESEVIQCWSNLDWFVLDRCLQQAVDESWYRTVALNPYRHQMASWRQRNYWLQQGVSYGLWFLSGLLFCSSLGIGLFSYQQAQSLLNHTLRYQQRAAEQRAQLARLQPQLQAMPLPLHVLKALVPPLDQALAPGSTCLQIFTQLGDALEAAPELRLLSLNWSAQSPHLLGIELEIGMEGESNPVVAETLLATLKKQGLLNPQMTSQQAADQPRRWQLRGAFPLTQGAAS
jgi:hypothetical protein